MKGKYVYIIKSTTEDLYAIQVNNGFKWGSFDEATIFADHVKANKVLASIPRIDRKSFNPVTIKLVVQLPVATESMELSDDHSTYEMITIADKFIQEDVPEIEDDTRKFEEILKDTPCSLETIKLLNEVEALLTIYNSLRSKVNVDMSTADRGISDLYHFVEFNKFSGSGGYKIAKKLQDLTQDRRIHKNDLMLLDYLKSIITFTDDDVSKLKKNCTKMNARLYTPRELDVKEDVI